MKKGTQKVKPKIETRERENVGTLCFWMQLCLKLLLLQTLHSIPINSLFSFSIMIMNRWIRHDSEVQNLVGGNIQIKDSNMNGCREPGAHCHSSLSFKILRPRKFKLLWQELELSYHFMVLPYFPNKVAFSLLAIGHSVLLKIVLFLPIFTEIQIEKSKGII